MPKRLVSSIITATLVIGILVPGMSNGPPPRLPGAYAEEIDCEDKDNVDLPECKLLRQQNPPPEESPPAPPPEGEEQPPDAPPWPDKIAKKNNPTDIIFQLADAGKEATQYDWKEGTDDCGKWALSRFERQRELSPSRLGPNVIYTKAWVCKNADAAKKLFKDTSAAGKNLRLVFDPIRTRGELVSGPNEKFKYESYAEETWAASAYYDADKWVGRHYTYVHRKGPNVGQIYLFGREDLFEEWSKGLEDWFSRTYAGRL